MGLKIIIIAVVYVLAIIGIVMLVNSMSNLFIPLILLSTLLFSILLIREIRKVVSGKFKPVENAVIYNQTTKNNEVSSARKISEKPFLFGLEKGLVSDNEFYFDENNFYAFNNRGERAEFPLQAIVELSGTSVIISNRRIWMVKVATNNGIIEFKFGPNFTLWNKSFEVFYNKIKMIKPEAVKSNWSLWRM